MKRYKVNLKGQKREYSFTEDGKNISNDESKSNSSLEIENEAKTNEVLQPKSKEVLITIHNPNRSNNAETSYAMNILKKEKKIEESHKLYDEGLTIQAQEDLARLAIIRRQREIDAKKLEEEKTRKEEEQKIKREAAMLKLNKNQKQKRHSKHQKK